MYSISLIDRTNLGLALVAGMQEDLGLAVGNRYTVIVMVFFVAYVYVFLMIWAVTNTNQSYIVFSKFRVYVNYALSVVWWFHANSSHRTSSCPRLDLPTGSRFSGFHLVRF